MKQEGSIDPKTAQLGEIVGFSLYVTKEESKQVIMVGSSGLVQKINLASGDKNTLGGVLGPVSGASIGGVPVAGTEGKQTGVRQMLVAANERGASLYTFPSLQHICDLPSTLARFNSIAFDNTRKNILLGGGDGVMYRWKLFNEDGDFDPTRNDALERYFGLSSSVLWTVPVPKLPNIFLSVDDSGVLSGFRTYDSDRFAGEYDKSLFYDRAYADDTSRKNLKLKSEAPITAEAVSSDGQFIALGGQDGSLEIIGSQGLARKALVKLAHRGDVLSVAFLPGPGPTLYLGSIGRDGQVVLWRIEGHVPEGRASQVEYKVTPLKISTVIGGYKLLAIGALEVAVATRDSKVLALKFTL